MIKRHAEFFQIAGPERDWAFPGRWQPLGCRRAGLSQGLESESRTEPCVRHTD